MLERYQEENENLKKHFGVDLDLSIDDAADLDEFSWSGPSAEELYDILAYLWVEKDVEIAELKARATKLRQRNSRLNARNSKLKATNTESE